jgi:hypothetical protein
MSCPSMLTEPASGSYARMISLSTVDLPEPDEPTIAVFLRAGTVYASAGSGEVRHRLTAHAWVDGGGRHGCTCDAVVHCTCRAARATLCAQAARALTLEANVS